MSVSLGSSTRIPSVVSDIASYWNRQKENHPHFSIASTIEEKYNGVKIVGYGAERFVFGLESSIHNWDTELVLKLDRGIHPFGNYAEYNTWSKVDSYWSLRDHFYDVVAYDPKTELVLQERYPEDASTPERKHIQQLKEKLEQACIDYSDLNETNAVVTDGTVVVYDYSWSKG